MTVRRKDGRNVNGLGLCTPETTYSYCERERLLTFKLRQDDFFTESPIQHFVIDCLQYVFTRVKNSGGS